MTYSEWMRQVEEIIFSIAGLISADLSDHPFYDWYHVGYSPRAAAVEALEREGYYD